MSRANLWIPCWFLLMAAGAQASDWSVELGWSPVVPGTWLPLTVTTPPQAGPWSIEVRAVSASGRVGEAVVFGQPSGGVFEWPVFLADATRSFRLSFHSEGLTEGPVDLPLSDRLFPGHVFGVDGVDGVTRSALAEVLMPQEPVRVVALPPSRWPASALAYGGLSALVLADPGPVLSPAQVTAVRAWRAAGGRLVLLQQRVGTDSLAAQVGPASATIEAGLAGLRPYGEQRLWGTDFDPPARNLVEHGAPDGPAAVVFVVVWGGLGALWLVLRRGGVRGTLVVAMVAAAVVLTLGALDFLSWDRGTPVHTREVELPGHAGRFVSVAVRSSPQRAGFLDWTEASPWALAAWREATSLPDLLVRVRSADLVVLEGFRPTTDREPSYRVHTEGSLRWSMRRGDTWVPLERAPALFEADVPWIAKLAANQDWDVGGDSVWVRPVERRP